MQFSISSSIPDSTTSSSTDAYAENIGNMITDYSLSLSEMSFSSNENLTTGHPGNNDKAASNSKDNSTDRLATLPLTSLSVTNESSPAVHLKTEEMPLFSYKNLISCNPASNSTSTSVGRRATLPVTPSFSSNDNVTTGDPGKNDVDAKTESNSASTLNGRRATLPVTSLSVLDEPYSAVLFMPSEIFDTEERPCHGSTETITAAAVVVGEEQANETSVPSMQYRSNWFRFISIADWVIFALVIVVIIFVIMLALILTTTTKSVPVDKIILAVALFFLILAALLVLWCSFKGIYETPESRFVGSAATIWEYESVSPQLAGGNRRMALCPNQSQITELRAITPIYEEIGEV